MSVDLLGLKPCLEDHCNPSTVAFTLLDILEAAKYSRAEIVEVAAFMAEYAAVDPVKTTAGK